MSMESRRAQAELVAAELIQTTYGGTDDEEFTLHYDRLRDLLALAYLTGGRDTLDQVARTVDQVASAVTEAGQAL